MKMSQIFFRGGKEEWLKVYETTLAKDKKEQDLV